MLSEKQKEWIKSKETEVALRMIRKWYLEASQFAIEKCSQSSKKNKPLSKENLLKEVNRLFD